MKEENQTGWYALYLSITQNLSPARALRAMEKGRGDVRPLRWEEFLEIYRAGETRRREDLRRRSGTEKWKQYQREYRRTHPLPEEKRLQRIEYMRRYRQERRNAGK